MKTEQEKSIQMAQDNILSVAQQNQEYREQQVKQAQIDVLNKLKEKFKGYEAWYYNGIEEGYHDLEEEIDELIKEIEDVKEI